MSYIEENMMEGEKIVARATLHPFVYYKPALLAVLAIVLPIVLFIAYPDQLPVAETLIAAAVLLVVAAIWAAAIHGNRQYILTNRRLIEKVGIIRRESSEILLRKCEGVKLVQSIPGRIFNYGTVVVSTTGESFNDYHFIKDPVRFQTLVNQQIEHLSGYGSQQPQPQQGVKIEPVRGDN